MKKVLFFLCYFLTPVLPVLFYLNSSGASLDTYTLSIILGITAFILLCNQFILASRPPFAVKTLGTKAFMSFHAIMPFLILVLAGIHKLLKESNGFTEEVLQARLGAIGWWVFAFIVVFAVLLMANTIVMKISFFKDLKAWVYRKTGLSYKGARFLHNITVLAALLIMVHVFLASSSDFTANPAGIISMISWMIISLGFYFNYRLKGRIVKGK